MDAALSSAVSALTSQSTALATISTNLANSSTTGYKAVSTQFISLVDTTSSSTTSSSASSGGVTTTSRQNVTETGTITSSSTTTDMAIDGNGFFVVSDGTNTYYTRDGEFTTDDDGNLYLSGTSYYLMGWATDSSGSVIASDESSLSSLEVINVNEYASTASATTTYSLGANLPAEAQDDVTTVSYTNDDGDSESLNYSWVSTGTDSDGNDTYLVTVTSSNSSVTLDDGTTSGVSALTYTVSVDSDGNIVSVTGTSENTVGYSGTELPSSITASDDTSSSIDTSDMTWSELSSTDGYSTTSTMTIYDSLGTEEDVSVTWTAAGDNTWIMTVSGVTDSDGSTSGTLSDASGATTSSYSYLVTFNSDGSLASITPISQMNGDTISTAPTDESGDAEISVYSWTDNASASTVTLGLGTSGDTDGLTQYDSGSSSPSISITSQSQDGYEYGTLESVAISDGDVIATYTNGESITIYKVAVATFVNANGLESLSDGVYAQTSSSGSYTLHESGEDGAGTVEGSSLESSTVDSTTEFSDMIVCQQAYSAASQIISTTSKMFETLMQSAS